MPIGIEVSQTLHFTITTNCNNFSAVKFLKEDNKIKMKNKIKNYCQQIYILL